MKRRTLLAFIVTLSIVVIGIMTSTATTSAQIKMCDGGCYTVDLTKLEGIPDVCWPICIQTVWANGVIWPDPDVPCYRKPLTYTECPPVRPGTLLDKIIICGNSIPATPGQYTVECSPDCIFCVTVCLDKRGCLYIKLYWGRCPDFPLPCP